MTTSRFSPSFGARLPAQKAFSLVEVALAVGVVAFAFVGLLALLPMGLANFRGATDTSISAQIFQKVVGDAEQADFDTLIGTATSGTSEFYVLPTRFFDDQGTEVVPRSPGQPSPYEGKSIIYQCRVRGSVPGPNTVDPKPPELFTSLPSSSYRFNPRDSTILTIQIVHQPGIVSLPVDADLLWVVPPKRSSALSIVTYSAVITRNGFGRPDSSP